MVYKKHCCYGICKSDSRYPEKDGMEGVFLINFPKPITRLEKCMRWIKSCGRPQTDFNVKKVNKNTFICSKHFVGGNGPTDDHPDPIPATANNTELEKFTRVRRRSPTQRHTSAPTKRKRLDTSEDPNEELQDELRDTKSASNQHVTGECEPEILNLMKDGSGTQTDPVHILPGHADSSTQTIYNRHELQYKIENMILRNEMCISSTSVDEKCGRDSPSLGLDLVKGDDKEMKFFTGLTFLQFIALFNFLGPASSCLRYWNRKAKPLNTKPVNELFITLVRLRRGYCFKTLSYFFKLSQTALRCICTTWIQFFYCHFDSMRGEMFPSRNILKKSVPKSFKGFKNVRCSVDCTEFYVQMPRNLSRQSNLFSNYKHHHTFKCLIAVAPNGTAVFVSKLYEGSMSDREVFEKCGILNHLHQGDLSLVDRGFTVEDLLSRQIHMNIPPFLKGRDNLTPQEELLTRKIAKARIHVERFNERIKKFRLVSGIMPLSMTPMATQAVFLACCLVNFQDQLAK